MSGALAKTIVVLIGIIMFALFMSPLALSFFYLLVRPLLGPLALLKYDLVPGINISAIPPLIVILFAFSNSLFRRKDTLFPPNIIPIYLLMFFSVLSLYNTMDFVTSLAQFLKMLVAPCMYLLIYNGIKSKKDARRVLYVVGLASVIPMLFGYYEFLVTRSRVASFFNFPNAYGEFLSLTIFAVLMLLPQEKNKLMKIFLLVILISLVASSILSLNRGSWISVIAGLGISSLFYYRYVKLRWIVIPALLVGVVFSGMIIQRFHDLEERPNYLKKNTLETRMENWERTSRLIPKHPFIGHGIGTAKLVNKKYYKIESVPHNDYLRLALEVGIPCSLFYIFFLMKEFFANLKAVFRRENQGINFPMMAAIIYFAIITGAQNIISDVSVFPLLFVLIAVSRKWNLFEAKE